MRVIEGQIKAWLPGHGDPQKLNGDVVTALGVLSFTNQPMELAGYSLVGNATIRVEVVDNEQLIANKVTSLKAELAKARADAQMRENELNDKINQLLAITCNVTEVEAA